MFQESVDLWYGALAIAVVLVAGFLAYLLWALAKLVLEGKRTVEDVNKKLEKIDPVVNESTTTLTDLLKTLRMINDNVLKPVANFSQVIGNVRRAVEVFRGKKESK